MTLDEAIKVLGRTYPPYGAYGNPRSFEKLRVITEATRLGIEALRRIKDARTDEVEVEKGLLPGEPEDTTM